MNMKANWLESTGELRIGSCITKYYTTKSNHEREGIGRSLAIRDHKIIERSAASVSSLAREVGKCSFRYIFYHSVFQ